MQIDLPHDHRRRLRRDSSGILKNRGNPNQVATANRADLSAGRV